jgi:hypothetical protein
MNNLLIVTSIVVSLVGVLAGLFLLLNPALVIKFQIKFYEMINWRMEPISMAKELRNTKIMGLFLFLISWAGDIYILGKFFIWKS